MSVLDAETKARLEYKSNPDKILSKLTYSYCQRKVLIPFDMSENTFNRFLADYKNQFPNGTILDALWAYNVQAKMYPSKFVSRMPLALGQIAELEGRYEIALKNFLECLVLEIVEDLESFKTLAPYHKEWGNNPINYLNRAGFRDLLDKGSLVGDRLYQIIKKSQTSKKEIFETYKYRGAIPNCCLTVEEINNYIQKSIVE